MCFFSKSKLSLAILCLALSSSPTLANWKVDQRAETLSIAKELTYRYEVARGEIEKPTDGLNARIAKIHADLKQWVIDCAKLKNRVDSAQGTSLGVFEAQLTDDAIQSAKKFDSIYTDAIDMHSRLTILIQSLTSARRVDYELSTYQSEYHALVAAVDNLIANLRTTDEKLIDLMSDIRTTIPSLNSALLSRLKINLINQNLSNVEEAIGSARSLLTTDEALDALTKPFKADVKLFNKYYLEARYFSVLDLGGKLQSDCSDMALKISNIKGHQGVKDSYLKATQSLCSTVASNVKAYAASKPGDVVASSIIDLRLGRLKKRCQQTNPGLAKCGMLVWLNNLTRDQIKSYDNNTLRGLEVLWAEAEGETGARQ
jgi:hypothetical protein